jgi:hypothetical protein
MRYMVVVENHGPSDANYVIFEDWFIEGIDGLADATWTCEATLGAECGDESGSGTIQQIDLYLPVGGVVLFEIEGKLMTPFPFTNTACAEPIFPYDLIGGGIDPDEIECIGEDPYYENNCDYVVNRPINYFLPIIPGQYWSRPFAPDLGIIDMKVYANKVELTIMNMGLVPVTEPFWIDVYVEPERPPVHVNQPWPVRGYQGLVWGIDYTALPLAPGEQLTLMVSYSGGTLYGDMYFYELGSWVEWPIGPTDAVYAQVDSYGGYYYGAVLEEHEITNDPYNNIVGPFYKMGGSGPEEFPSFADVSRSFEGLPVR